MSTIPMSPAEVKQAQAAAVPAVVLDIVNGLLTQRGLNKVIIITQAEVVEALEERGVERQEVFEQHMLDFETAYEKVGWRVVYDKPGYNELYGARWSFEVC